MLTYLHIHSPGFLTTIQDLGRVGYERFGVPVSGAMDRFALRAANALVGNPPGAAGLEFTLQGPTAWLGGEGLVAAAGCGFELRVDGRRVPLWMAAWVRPGEPIELRSTGGPTGLLREGGWGYLALAGGLVTPEVLGSRSTYLRGGPGGLPAGQRDGWDGREGRALRAGDRLEVGEFNAYRFNADQLYNRAGLSLPPARRPAYSESPLLEVVLGPQPSGPMLQGRGAPNLAGPGGPTYAAGGEGQGSEDEGRGAFHTGTVSSREAAGSTPGGAELPGPGAAFSAEGLAAFLGGSYTLTPACDRMGYRLAGPAIARQGQVELLSEGIPLGAVQVPGDGQPIVLMADRQATGGYPKIAVLSSASLPLLAQCPVGAQVRFQAVSVRTAQAHWRSLLTGLEV